MNVRRPITFKIKKQCDMITCCTDCTPVVSWCTTVFYLLVTAY